LWREGGGRAVLCDELGNGGDEFAAGIPVNGAVEGTAEIGIRVAQAAQRAAGDREHPQRPFGNHGGGGWCGAQDIDFAQKSAVYLREAFATGCDVSSAA